MGMSLAQIESSIVGALGSYIVPPSCKSIISGPGNAIPSSPSAVARKIVSQAWREVGLTSKGQNEDSSMWDCGANVITGLLLSEYYRSHGYDIHPEDIIRNPSHSMQCCLVDGQNPETDSAENSVNSITADGNK